MNDNIIFLEKHDKFKGVRGSFNDQTDLNDPFHILNDIIKEGEYLPNNFIAASKDDRGDNMNVNSFEIFFDELKKDMREREARTRQEIIEREKRFEETLKSYHQENKEREERIYQLIKEIKNDNKEFKNDLKNEMSFIRDDFRHTKEEISNLTKHNESLATTNKWSNIATIIGISAIVVAVVIALVLN